jgi:hypothetical protein
MHFLWFSLQIAHAAGCVPPFIETQCMLRHDRRYHASK